MDNALLHPPNSLRANVSIFYPLETSRNHTHGFLKFLGLANWNTLKIDSVTIFYLKILCSTLISCYYFRKTGGSAKKPGMVFS